MNKLNTIEAEFQMDVTNEKIIDIAGNKRLWLAIVEQTILDAKYFTQSAIDQLQEEGSAKEETILELKAILRSINSSWFKTICEYAEVSYPQIKTQIKDAITLDIKNVKQRYDDGI